MSRKVISNQLGIRQNTVHGQTKLIFRHFGVHSRVELITCCPMALAVAAEVLIST